MLWMSVMVPMLLSLSLFGAETVRIMPLGDSITHEDYRDPAMDAANAEANRTAYRADLWYALQSDNYNVDFVGEFETGQDVLPPFDYAHQGENGLHDEEMAANVYDYLTANPADIVLLHIGTNGLIGDESADDVEDTLNEIDRYESEKGTHVKVVLARIISCWKDWNNTAAGVSDQCDDTKVSAIQTFNNNVETMARDRITNNGDDIVIVDMESNAGIVYDSTDMTDDLHPNATGYAKMANVWYEALETSIPTHQWHLNESTQTAPGSYEDVYRGANGACSGECPTATPGQVAGAQLFDDTADEITLADDNSYEWNSTDSFTISFWVNTPSGGTGTEVFIGRDNRPTTKVQWWVGYDTATGYITFSLIDSADVPGSIEDTSHAINDGLWHHVSVVRDGVANTNSIYVDGILGISDLGEAYTGNFGIVNKGITLGNLSPAHASYHSIMVHSMK